MLGDGKPVRKAVRKRLAPHNRQRQRLYALDRFERVEGVFVVVALTIGHVQNRTRAQRLVDVPRLGDQGADLDARPQMHAPRLKGYQHDVGDGEGGAQAPRVATSGVDNDLVIFLAQQLHLLSDRRPVKPDRRKRGWSRIGLGAYLGEGRGATLFVGVDHENVATALRENGSDVDGEQALAYPAFDVRYRKDH